MKKLFHIIKILIFNTLLFALLICICDFFIYGYNYVNYKYLFKKSCFKYMLKANYLIDFNTYFDGSDNVYQGRKPDGLEYTNKPPIVIFGCSFVQGQFLNYYQTVSYKLANILKRPVYNRGIAGKGIQHMYWQSVSQSFYNDVPPADDVIYIFIDDHYRRLYLFFLDILDLHLNGHFSVKNNNIIPDNEKNYLGNLIKSSYTFKLLNSKYVNFYINNPKNAEKITDDVLTYFIKTRENLESHWHKKINFTVIIFDSYIKYGDLLIKKLKDNNFKVIEIKELTQEDLTQKEYVSEKTNHPTEKCWDLLAPLIAEKLNL